VGTRRLGNLTEDHYHLLGLPRRRAWVQQQGVVVLVPFWYTQIMREFKSRLDHIGIAVEAVPSVKKLFSILGLHVVHTEAMPAQRLGSG
jgi:hypothetical protein